MSCALSLKTSDDASGEAEGPIRLNKTGKKINPWNRPKSTTIPNICAKKGRFFSIGKLINVCVYLKESCEDVRVTKCQKHKC